MSYRIGFAGASGTGKTKLVDFLQPLLNVPICPIGSRSVAALMGLSSPYDADALGVRERFQHRLFHSKRIWEISNDQFLTDRTAFDNLTYASMHGCALGKPGIEPYVFAMRRYTHVFYLPLARFQKLGLDDTRRKDPDYHVVYDLLLRSFLQAYAIDHVALECPPEDRTSFLTDVLNLRILKKAQP
jgi:hypothetical protein